MFHSNTDKSKIMKHILNISIITVSVFFIIYFLEGITNYFPGMFDLIFCGFVLHHLKNPKEVLRKLWSMLNSNGVLLVRTFDEGLKLDYPPDKDLMFLLSE